MNLSTELQEALNQWAAIQGISPDDLLQQAVTEKLNSLQRPPQSIEAAPATEPSSRLRRKNGILILETDSNPSIDINAWIEELREERIRDQMGL
ncbi:hypothetical protein [Alkalinema sp. FACHB-956]|uniref:hypothetical protein n=1 Tax=Alkalinema sp. FACHB-956 TaxID=2692768 RepID=UPI0016820755|nr:hypothetical protein [Alkalinema sp. FACHB-956]MBD2329102.1 hypothetical protein [Alkalinema sp. FACHB-956]